jgi:hypothetical protein
LADLFVGGFHCGIQLGGFITGGIKVSSEVYHSGSGFVWVERCYLLT